MFEQPGMKASGSSGQRELKKGEGGDTEISVLLKLSLS